VLCVNPAIRCYPAAAGIGRGGGLVSQHLISIVDDDEPFREAMTSLMKSLGFEVEAFSSAEAFLESPRLGNTSCVIADVHMPTMTGIDLHQQLVASGRTIPVILITAYPDDNVRARALAAGVICYLSKTFDDDALLGFVRSALVHADQEEAR
jgi:FixJ family two-component response regulator